jgi:acetyl esterase/lipase
MNDSYIGCSYEEFPHSKIFSEGIQIIPAHVDEISCRTLCDVPYRTVDGKDLHLHIMIPTLDHHCTERFPCIVYVQGSGWMKQTHGRELVQLARMAQRGYVVAIVQYRHSEWAPFPAQIMDTKYAVQYMMEHAEEYFVNTDQLILWGDSSGAHTALMTCLTRKHPKFQASELKEYPVRCLIDYYGPIDISEMQMEPTTQNHSGADSPEGLLIGGKEVTKENAKDTIVTNYVTCEKKIPPVLIFHGSKDRIVPFGQSVLLYNALKDAQKQVECYQVYGADHGDDPFWNQQILGIVDAFIQKTL